MRYVHVRVVSPTVRLILYNNIYQYKGVYLQMYNSETCKQSFINNRDTRLISGAHDKEKNSTTNYLQICTVCSNDD